MGHPEQGCKGTGEGANCLPSPQLVNAGGIPIALSYIRHRPSKPGQRCPLRPDQEPMMSCGRRPWPAQGPMAQASASWIAANGHR